MALYECYINSDCEIEADSIEEAKASYLEFLSSEIDINDIIVHEIVDEE